MLKCKPGELAMVISGPVEHLGKVVECLSFNTVREHPNKWVVTPNITKHKLFQNLCMIEDYRLKPFRISNSPDETLLWAGAAPIAHLSNYTNKGLKRGK